MARDTFFVPSDAEDEISRLSRPSKQVVWTTPEGRLIPVTVPPTVYPPKEDTDLLAKCVHRLKSPKGKRLLEIGCGSGVVSMFAAQKGFHVTACDINPFAVAATRASALENKIPLQVNEGGPGPRDDGSTGQWAGNQPHDFIVWNLPYLTPRIGEQHLGPLEEAALLDTDHQGLVKRLLQQVRKNRLLKPDGVVFLVVSSAGTGAACQATCISQGFASRTVESASFSDGEQLNVIAAWNPYSNSESEHVESIPSTSSHLLQGEHGVGTLLTADVQTSGHGRRGRQWVHGTNAFAGSWVLHHGTANFAPGIMQLRAGLALQEAIQSLTQCPERVLLKWPNDVLLQSPTQVGKVGGVLIEGMSRSKTNRFVLGIGCNMTTETFGKVEFQYAALDELVEGCDLDVFTRTLHASVASWFEQKEDVQPTSIASTIRRFEQALLPSLQLSNDLLYRGKSVTFSSISSEGHIELQLFDDTYRTIDEGEDLEWQF
ncbi:MAG: hypothetical protein CMA63_05205 [Euryarchaeota archaeon]|nr:hypothetical protein [Euryarchaeota archaeon]